MMAPDELHGTGPAAAPTVSIVTATYGRPKLLRFAIESVLAQDFPDWELIVVGDGCGDATEAVVRRFDDSRIRFFNLPFNFGEQTGPNNVGIRRARGRYIAFLNQDDLWLPDHLSLAVGWLEATAADMVLMMGASFDPSTDVERASGRWRLGLVNRGRDGWYDPATTDSVVSTHLVDRRVYDQIGYWRPAAECLAFSSEDFIFRAWRSGLAIRCAPHLSVLVFSSGSRRNSYVDGEVAEQEFFSDRMRTDPARLRLAIVDHLARLEPRTIALRRRLSVAGLRLLARCGVRIRERRIRRHFKVSRGGYVNHLRSVRGLAPMPAIAPRMGELRRRYRTLAAYRPGEPLDFSATGNGFLVCAEGWSIAEDWGTWSDGTTADLVFHLAEPPAGPLKLTLVVKAFLHGPHQEQAVDVAINGVDVASWDFRVDSVMREFEIPIPALPPGSATVIVTMRIRSPRSPKALGLSSDTRQLGVGLLRAVLVAAADG